MDYINLLKSVGVAYLLAWVTITYSGFCMVIKRRRKIRLESFDLLFSLFKFGIPIMYIIYIGILYLLGFSNVLLCALTPIFSLYSNSLIIYQLPPEHEEYEDATHMCGYYVPRVTFYGPFLAMAGVFCLIG